MARLNWDMGLTMIQRRSLLKVSLGAVSFVLGIFCVLLYTNGTETEASLWLLALGNALMVVTIVVVFSGLRGLMRIVPPSMPSRNEDKP
ncbi:hypothetical protein MCEMIH15_02884 [Caulobacteraceae bacterium]